MSLGTCSPKPAGAPVTGPRIAALAGNKVWHLFTCMFARQNLTYITNQPLHHSILPAYSSPPGANNEIRQCVRILESLEGWPQCRKTGSDKMKGPFPCADRVR